jgi:predicted O-linked N-acetylglucosamine transferase (SPINDLY family)
VQERLRNAAAALGVEPARIVFAPRLKNSHHLARYPLADVFLDTAPYGAHTTASDALWMGVPVVTFSGRGFASRVTEARTPS